MNWCVLAVLNVVLLTGPEASAPAKAEPSAASPKEMVQTFLKKLQQGTAEAAFEELCAGAPLREQGAQYQVLKSQAAGLPAILGPLVDSDFLDQREIGQSVVVVRYLTRYEKDAVTWTVVFYRSRERWMVTAMKFLTSIQYLE